MNEIIEGLLYDTDTSTSICSLINKPLTYSDPHFNIKDASIYLTANGRYFIAGHGTSTKRMEVIVPIGQDVAKKLTGKYAQTAVYKYFFGEPELA